MKTKNLLLVLLTMLCISSISNAQITFQKTYGGSMDYNSYSVQQTNDGGYIIAGSTHYFGAGLEDVYLIKTTAFGDTMWTKTYGGINKDYGYSIQQTSDRGFIIAGTTLSFGMGNRDVYLIKTDSNGTAMWTKTYGGTGNDEAKSVQQTIDDGYIITGRSISFSGGFDDVYLIKTDPNGALLWSKTYGGTMGDWGYSVQQTSDGGYVIAGMTSSAGSYDGNLIKTNNNGDTLWTKSYGGNGYENFKSVKQTIDGGYIIAGTTSSFGAGSYDIYLVKTDAIGDTIWSKTYGGTNEDWGRSVEQTNDGGFVIAAHVINISAGITEIYLIKTNSSGDSIWTRTFGGTSNNYGAFFQKTTDGGYIIVGMTESFGADSIDAYLIKTDSNGNSNCNQGNFVTIIGTAATMVTNPPNIIISPATIETVPSTVVGRGGMVNTLCIITGITEIIAENSFIIFPNPAADNLTIETPQKATIEILNIQGQLLKTLTTTEDKTSVDVSGLPGGVYIIKVSTEEGSVVRKFIKE